MNTKTRLAQTKGNIERDPATAAPKPRRRVARKVTAPNPQLPMPIPELTPPPQEPLDPRNAWQRAAEVMVEEAFSRNRDLADACRRPAAAIFIEVGVDWLHWVAEAWGRMLYSDAPVPADGDGFDGDRFLRSIWHDDDALTSLWCEYRREARPAKQQAKGTTGLAWALGRGLPVYGFAPSLDCLPPSFAKVYERHVVIPPLDGEILGKVVAAICGAPSTIPIPNEIVDKITETELSLAMRPGQTADAYVDRIIRLASAADTTTVAPASITLEAVGGMADAVAWGRSLARDLDDYKAGRIPWSDVDPGVLLHGRPGTGKTTFARALAGSCGVPLVAGSLQDWQSSGGGYLGDTLKAMKASFAEAQRAAPAILFIDEIDSFQARTSERGHNKSYHVQVVNQLLELLDGVKGRDGVVVVAAANNVDQLDPAIVRAGRLDTVIEIPLPSVDDLERIMRIHLGELLPDADLRAAARKAEGCTGADVKRWVRRARRAARTERRQMRMDDLMAAIDVPDVAVTESVLRRFAVHEAGHALFVALDRPGALILTTVRQSSGAGGYSAVRPDPDWSAATASTMRSAVSMLLAGRAAEQIIYGEVCGGSGGSAGSDLARATVLATGTIASLGLSDLPVWLGTVDQGNVGRILSSHPAVAAAVQAMLVECHQQALDALRPRKDMIVTLADLLVAQETVTGEFVEKLINSSEHPRNAKIAKQGPSGEGRKP